MSLTPLTSQLASQIADWIRDENAPAGTRLVERKLAEQLKVSRSPIRGALRLLESEGILGGAEGGGYVVRDPGKPLAAAEPRSTADDDVYQQIAEDRLNERLATKVSENALLRRYGLSRPRLAKILARIQAEGWIERLPGHGWAFLPMLTSMQAYEDSYRFRLAIEPAAILEPTFALDRPALEAARAQQQALVDGEIWQVSNPDLFDRNSRFHETIIECSRNLFFIESLRRIDRLRRLMEYRQSLQRKYALVQCREHLRLADLLLADKRQAASDLMRRHLSEVSREKIVSGRSIEQT